MPNINEYPITWTTIEFNVKPRTIVKHMARTRSTIEWYNSVIRQLKKKDIMQQDEGINFDILWYNINKEIKDADYYKHVTKHAFTIKMLINELPTMANLERRRPDIYLTNLCVRCKTHKEDNTHLIACKAARHSIVEKFNNLSENIIATLYQDNKTKTRINKEIQTLYKTSVIGENKDQEKYLFQLVTMTITNNHLLSIKNILRSKSRTWLTKITNKLNKFYFKEI
jgi:hypothetical protein